MFQPEVGLARARLGKASGYCSYFAPSSSLIEQLEIDHSQRMTACAYSPPPGAACHLSLRQRAFSSGSRRVSSLSSEQSGDITVIIRPELWPAFSPQRISDRIAGFLYFRHVQ